MNTPWARKTGGSYHRLLGPDNFLIRLWGTLYYIHMVIDQNPAPRMAILKDMFP